MGPNPDAFLQKLSPRWFLTRDVHAEGDGICVVKPRWAMSFLRGPMTRCELQTAMQTRNGTGATETPRGRSSVQAHESP